MSSADVISTSFSPGEKTGDTTFYMGHGRDGEWNLVGIGVIPIQTCSGASNVFSIAITDGSDTVATTLLTSTTALTAGTGVQCTMTGTAGANREFGATDSVKFVCTETAGAATLEAQFICHWQKARV